MIGAVPGYRDPELDVTQELPRLPDRPAASLDVSCPPARTYGIARPCCDHLSTLCPACMAELRGET